MSLLFALILVSPGCRKSDDRKAVGTGGANGGATGSGAAQLASGSGSADSATIEPWMRELCVWTMQTAKGCFNDEGFWEAFGTGFFAEAGRPVTTEEKQSWLKVAKANYAALTRENELEQNCDDMLAELRLPTKENADLVRQARQQSCGAFGGALGVVIWSQGVFSKPRGEVVPDAFKLAPGGW